ncbi:MAG: hypothetical protein JXA73_05500 [Acidobacteria bacterium]|nr:hypothetical protein [Acidobacteriota bacterium]
MSDSFLRAYSELTDFISANPEIEIGESVTSIPGEVRPGFYDRFNAARKAFLEEKFPEFVSKSRRLQQEYCKAGNEAAGLLSMEDTPEVNRIRRYLRDPEESLARELFDPLFDLLKKRKSLGSFEETALARITEVFPAVYRGGYEKWAILSLANLLDADKALRVPVRELQAADRAKSSAFAPTEEVPSPMESTSFFFSQPHKSIFAVPDFILHSTGLNRFIGIRSEFKEGIYNALNASSDREWYTFGVDHLILLASGLTLLYVSERPERISLIADVKKFCRPDLLLWCVDTQAISRNEALGKMELADSLFRPAGGSFLAAGDLWPDTGDPAGSNDRNERAEEMPSRIRILNVGFDRLQLIPVVEALRDTKGSAITA